MCLISTFHDKIETNRENKKPEMICFYDNTKVGVDILDMKFAFVHPENKMEATVNVSSNDKHCMCQQFNILYELQWNNNDGKL